MIADNNTNFIYFSDLLRTKSEFSVVCSDITGILDKHQIRYDFLKGTNDIWARDYMPIQASNDKFIEYRYDPDYLQAKKYRKIKSYPDIICDAMGLKTVKTNLIIDGGNIIKTDDCIIATDKIVEENKDLYTKDRLLAKIRELFEIDKVILIPWDKEHDYFGHADGMIRFIDNETVLVQKYFDDYPDRFKRDFFGILEDHDINWKKLKFDVELEDERNWAYMNFLQTRDLILVPSFGIPEDQQAFDQLVSHYPEYADGKVKQVDMTEIVNEGGALNCITWTILE